MKVAILVCCEEGMNIVQETIEVLESFTVSCDVFVLLDYGNVQKTVELVRNIERNDYEVIVVADKMATPLPGIVSAYTTLPVIGVPIATALSGLDSLLSMCQLKPGMPVATMAINGGRNAALFVIAILALKDEQLKTKLIEYREDMKRKVLQENQQLF